MREYLEHVITHIFFKLKNGPRHVDLFIKLLKAHTLIAFKYFEFILNFSVYCIQNKKTIEKFALNLIIVNLL